MVEKKEGIKEVKKELKIGDIVSEPTSFTHGVYLGKEEGVIPIEQYINAKIISLLIEIKDRLTKLEKLAEE